MSISWMSIFLLAWNIVMIWKKKTEMISMEEFLISWLKGRGLLFWKCTIRQGIGCLGKNCAFFHNSLQPLPRKHRFKRPSKLSTRGRGGKLSRKKKTQYLMITFMHTYIYEFLINTISKSTFPFNLNIKRMNFELTKSTS